MMKNDNPFEAYFDCGGMHGYSFDVRHYIPDGHVVVPRDRYERLLVAAESAYESVNAPYDPDSEGGGELWASAEQALVRAVTALQPGDTDPLPD